MSQTDTEFVQLCLDGHPEAFRQLVERHEAAVMAYLCGVLRDKDLAEEIAQEAFVRSFFLLKTLRKHESFFPWLVGIAGRVAREVARDRQKRMPLPDAPVPARDRPEGADYDLEGAVAALPEPYRQVVLMRYYERLSCAETAARLDVPIGTVTKRLSRAYEMLRKLLGHTPAQDDLEVRK